MEQEAIRELMNEHKFQSRADSNDVEGHVQGCTGGNAKGSTYYARSKLRAREQPENVKFRLVCRT
ncbi:hypothetical protein WG8_1064 [Paenibacillus sp. Aloe-11]|nr:hypothetical protein WG8_1064 [Paenibacillus sp. Aloe-11]